MGREEWKTEKVRKGKGREGEGRGRGREGWGGRTRVRKCPPPVTVSQGDFEVGGGGEDSGNQAGRSPTWSALASPPPLLAPGGSGATVPRVSVPLSGVGEASRAVGLGGWSCWCGPDGRPPEGNPVTPKVPGRPRARLAGTGAHKSDVATPPRLESSWGF